MQGERRRYPRIKTDLPIEIQKEESDAIVQGTISDLSSTGVQVACSPDEAERFGTRGQQIDVQVRFRVPAPDAAPVAARCRLVFARRVCADRYCVGLNFIDVDDDSFANLAAFMETRL